MNVIEAASELSDFSITDILAKEARSLVCDIAAAYRALAPDWSQAPEGATLYVIHADGKAEWIRGLTNDVLPIQFSSKWSYQNAWWSEHHALIDLPVGIDWRLCKWLRPEVQG